MKFGKVITSFRKKFSMEQKALAEALGISVPFLSLLENDKRKTSAKLLSSIADYFGVPVSYLLYEASKSAAGIENDPEPAKAYQAVEPLLQQMVDYLMRGKNNEKEEEKKEVPALPKKLKIRTVKL
jgi:transcriptional regulator with XRE-family HTH domain